LRDKVTSLLRHLLSHTGTHGQADTGLHQTGSTTTLIRGSRVFKTSMLRSYW
jgi:hypothetical protein